MSKQEMPVKTINSISEVHRLMSLPAPKNPLITLINHAEEQPPSVGGIHRMALNFYNISIKKSFHGQLRYGRKYYDFDNGTMTFAAPNQIIAVDQGTQRDINGWSLMFHPDLIRNYSLGKSTKNYGFFAYDVNEALHLSEEEEKLIEGLVRNIQKEYESRIDSFSADVIVSNLDLLLNYCNRFYNRQFAKDEKIAFQITSSKDSQKVNNTLDVITAQQLTDYKRFVVFIIGEKQGSYTIDPTLCAKTGFNPLEDITDLDGLLKPIVNTTIEKLDSLLDLFNREFRQLKVEFEIVDKNGGFDSSLYNQLELKPASPPINAEKMKDYFDDDINLKSIKKVYKQLSAIPRASRELLAIIAERGTFRQYNHANKEWGILPQILEKLLRLSEKELKNELFILLDSKLIHWGEVGY